MGRYNPNAPVVLGEEWVGIRDENTQFSPSVDVVELGHRFTTLAANTLTDARFYVNEIPPNVVEEAYVAAIYAQGTEGQSGRIRKVIIPCDAVTASGLTLNGGVPAVQHPGNPEQLIFNGSASSSYASFSFNTQQYTVLNGKRILNVTFLHASQKTWEPDGTTTLGPIVTVGDNSNPASGTHIDYSLDLTPGIDTRAAAIQRISLGDVSRFWDTAGVSATTYMPWSYADLLRFDASSANRIYVSVEVGSNVSTPSGGVLFMNYAALEVTYCEEQRVAYGGSRKVDSSSASPLNFGANLITMRNPTTRAASPSLAAGQWTITLAAGDRGGAETVNTNLIGYPNLNAVRQVAPIEGHEGVKINLTTTEDDQLTVEATDILTQLSLHTSAGAITEVHSYGRVLALPVYGATYTVDQDIYTGDLSGATTYQQLRFYARRSAETNAPLSYAGTGGAAGNSGILTVAEFDELPELLDGWKEITRTLTATAGISGSSTMRWTSLGATAGRRWEMLAVSAPAISGVPGNDLSTVVSTHLLNPATYQPPSGATIDVAAQSPVVSGTTVTDSTSDLVFMFGQSPTTITGMAVTGAYQELTAFAECETVNCCLPSALAYHRITWPQTFSISRDEFDRTETDSWGSDDTDTAWTNEGGASTDYDVSPGAATHLLTSTNTTRRSYLPFSIFNTTVTVKVSVPILATGAIISTSLMLAYNSSTGVDYYQAELQWETDGTIDLRLISRVSNTGTELAAVNDITSYAGGETMWIKSKIANGRIYAKAWVVDTPEPDYWMVSAAATTITAAGGVGVRSIAETGNLNTPFSVTWSDWTVTNPTWSAFELQRSDEVDDWQTIMYATTPVTSFNDYEARVGTESSYRIRALNVGEFPGEWSSEVAATIAAPGVTLPSCGTDKRGVLIFTSNEDQDGAYNLAYAMTWEGAVSEDFQFVEAGSVQISQQLDRDFSVGFHGEERGGEAFSRTLLLANAAVALPRLGNMHDLRDMAWANVNYVCVRDDIGDRWLAIVIVPAGSVRRNRRLYNAEVTVIEATQTPTPVDP